MSKSDVDPEKDPEIDETVDEVPEDEGEGSDESTKKSDMDLPTALAALEDANRKIRMVNRESAGRRKEIATLKQQIDDLTNNGGDATKQLAALQAQLADANEKLRVVGMRDRFDTVVAKSKVNFANGTASRDAFTFAQEQLSKLPEDASDDEWADVVAEVVKVRPYLLVKPQSKNIDSDKKGTADTFAGLDLEAISRDFGIKP